MIRPLGRVTVPIAGTPVCLADIPAIKSAMDVLAGQGMKCLAFLFQASRLNTGYVGIGDSTINLTTEAGLLAVLPIPTANILVGFNAMDPLGLNPLDLSDIYLDVTVSGNGAILSVIIH